ncbi:hypothetical protein BCR35DRAFT_324588 [Leucosporidium creatinivorum]|uniref:MYND-type domain-containing protein n=1 Tax=Leucosporidium creatinivorum TaxID=106004 RepID=A0A1Y2FT36_9BASI|nr:hypothetical protein BCR35DRAFT_324588 [Leucosporidium creatinivorum]
MCMEKSAEPAPAVEKNIRGLGDAHQLAFTFRYEEKKDATVLAVPKGSCQMVLYHPTPQVPHFLPISDPFSLPFKMLVALETSAAAPNKGDRVPLMWCQYNGMRKADRLPVLSNTARDALKAARLEATRHQHPNERPREAFADLEKLYSKAKKTHPGQGEARIVGAAKGLVQLGPYCTVCARSDSLLKCTGCGVNHYCSRAHQKQDWPHHRDWCQKNPKSPTTSP